jgi:hypothetical protein
MASPPDGLVYGAQHDLDRLVRTHLFVISPNNSGSTVLKNALATSRHTWNLRREGQNTVGFQGPRGTSLRRPLLWAGDPETRAQAAGAVDWEASRRAWYFQAFARDPGASVFVEKSPPFVLRVAELASAFRDARFVFLVRDPYAVIEGILRRARRSQAPDLVATAARHVTVCLAAQRDHAARFAERGVLLRYEDLCADPAEATARIRGLVPVLGDLDLGQRVAVKGLYDEPLRDMNAEQIARLGPEVVREIGRELAPHRALLRHFGYALRDAA